MTHANKRIQERISHNPSLTDELLAWMITSGQAKRLGRASGPHAERYLIQFNDVAPIEVIWDTLFRNIRTVYKYEEPKSKRKPIKKLTPCKRIPAVASRRPRICTNGETSHHWLRFTCPI